MSTTVQPAREAGVSLEVQAHRLAPALIKGRRIFVECPNWCTVDHIEVAENFVEDIWHAGDYANLKVPQLKRNMDLFAFARLGFDDETDTTVVHVDDNSEGFDMSPEQAEQFADNLEAFAAAIRAMAKTAKGGA
jgi:hypothetical protein